jgi:glucose/arabinose dehydrogenase
MHHAIRSNVLVSCIVFAALLLTGCAQTARLSVQIGMGEHPELPAPPHALLPMVHVAKAVGWPAGTKPVPASGLAVAAFATGLDHPRWLYTLPNGDVLVAETNAPARPDDGNGL